MINWPRAGTIYWLVLCLFTLVRLSDTNPTVKRPKPTLWLSDQANTFTFVTLLAGPEVPGASLCFQIELPAKLCSQSESSRNSNARPVPQPLTLLRETQLRTY